MYELDKLSLDDSQKELRKCVFESELKNMCDMKSLNYMNCIHDNKINNIAKFNLLHGILNYYKYSKIWIAIIPVFYTDV